MLVRCKSETLGSLSSLSERLGAQKVITMGKSLPF